MERISPRSTYPKLLRSSEHLIEVVDDKIALCFRYSNNRGHESWIEEY